MPILVEVNSNASGYQYLACQILSTIAHMVEFRVPLSQNRDEAFKQCRIGQL